MRISYRYEPDICRCWLGVTDGIHYKEFALQSWMDVDEVIQILKTYESELIDEYSQ